MKEETKKEKTIEDLKLHETVVIVDKSFNEKKIEITRVPSGFLYTFEFPAWRICTTTFVPLVIKTNKK